MKPQDIADELNIIINSHFERKAKEQGAPRYFPKDFIKEELSKDKVTLTAIQAFCNEHAKVAPKPKPKSAK